MTDPLRVFFREGRLPPPRGFYKILETRVPADITVGDRVLVKPRKGSENVSIDSRYRLSPDAGSAIRHLAAQSYPFSLSPNVDVFERLVTPGAKEVIGKILDEAHITDLLERKLSREALEDWVIPTHEVQGHIEPNLNPEKCFWEPQLIWSFLIQCIESPTREHFLDWCNQWNDDLLMQLCLVLPAHEIYAMVRDEQAWKQLEGQTARSNETLSTLREYVRTKQNSTAVKILRFLVQKSGGDVVTLNKIMDTTYLEANASLSFSLPHLVRDLGRGVEIDRIPNHVREQTEMKWRGKYSSEELEIMIEEQHEAQRRMARDPHSRALLSTYVSLRVDQSDLSFEIYSAENSAHSIDAIPFIVTIQEARRILQTRESSIVVSPASSMEAILRRWLENLAHGRDDEPPYQFDIMKDLGKFYDQWKVSIVDARRRIFARPYS